jgi:hypothetical protein
MAHTTEPQQTEYQLPERYEATPAEVRRAHNELQHAMSASTCELSRAQEDGLGELFAPNWAVVADQLEAFETIIYTAAAEAFARRRAGRKGSHPMRGRAAERRFVVELTEMQLNAIYAAFARHEELCDLVDENHFRGSGHRRSLAELEAALMQHLTAVDDREVIHTSMGDSLFIQSPEEFRRDWQDPEDPVIQWRPEQFGWQTCGEFTNRERFTLQALKIPELELDLRFRWSIKTGYLNNLASHPWVRITVDNSTDQIYGRRPNQPADTDLVEQAHRLEQVLSEAGFTRLPGVENPEEGVYIATFRAYDDESVGDGYRTVYLHAVLEDLDGTDPFSLTPAPKPAPASFAAAQRLIRERGGCDIAHATLTGTALTVSDDDGHVTGYDPAQFDFGHGPTEVDRWARGKSYGSPNGWSAYARGWTQFEWEASAEAVTQLGLDLCSPNGSRLCRCSLVSPAVLEAANGHMRFPEAPTPQLFRCWAPIDWFAIADQDPTVRLEQLWNNDGPSIDQIRTAWNAALAAGGSPSLDVDAYLTEDRATRLQLSWLGVTFETEAAAAAAAEPISAALGLQPVPNPPERAEPTLEWMWC